MAHVAIALGLVSVGLVASGGAAVAAAPTCETSVVGVRPDGRLVDRWVTNTSVDKEFLTADPLSFPVDNTVLVGAERVTGGSVSHFNTFGSGDTPRTIDLTRQDGSTVLAVTVAATYVKPFSARLVAGSGSYYVYTVDGRGRLLQWTRERDSAGNLWFDSPKLVARHMGGLKTLSYSWSYKVDGRWNDFLYGTTRGGALKQMRSPFRKPANAKVLTVKKSGFAAYTGLSLAFCGTNAKYISLIGVDRVHNRARWYTLSGVLAPRASHLVRRGWVAPGAEWRLRAVS